MAKNPKSRRCGFLLLVWTKVWGGTYPLRRASLVRELVGQLFCPSGEKDCPWGLTYPLREPMLSLLKTP